MTDSIPTRILRRLPATGPQLAKRLGVPQSTIQTALHRLRQRQLIERGGAVASQRGLVAVWVRRDAAGRKAR
jgi:DNA-binding MarR family transcriptional regulator